MAEIYAKAPLNEVVFEVRFPAELKIGEERSRYYDVVKKGFPQINVPAFKAGDFPALSSFKYSSKDNKKALRVAINRFSYHDSEYAGGFEVFKKRVHGATFKIYRPV